MKHVSGVGLFCLSIFATLPPLTEARSQEAPAEALAAQLRRQGHRCESPVNVERDAERSKPDELVWVIKCTNATYRMRLVPHQAALVEQI